jgi:hypothetical protein
LFPEEPLGDRVQGSRLGIMEPIRHWEEEGFSLMRWVEDYYSEGDYDSDDPKDMAEGEDDEDEDKRGDDDWEDEDDQALDGKDDEELRELLEMVILQNKNHANKKSEFERGREKFMDFFDREKARSIYLMLMLVH